MNLVACASDERLRTGVVRDISEKRIDLDLPSGSVFQIGFTCEPIVCSTTRRFGVGDNVLLRLGAENNKNKLLSIRLCNENDAVCEKARNEELEESKYIQEQSEKWQIQMAQCDRDMKIDMKNDSRYIPDKSADLSDQERDEISDRYKTLYADPSIKPCLLMVVRDHQQAVIESCQKNNCGEDIGGGCYHIAGNSFNNSVFEVAINKCGI